jgi:formate--tetrahydrofolate ligase
VLVATIRALQHHGRGDLSVGIGNLKRHIRHLSSYGPPVVVAINQRAEDNPDDHAQLIGLCAEIGVNAIACNPWGGGGSGCTALAEEVIHLATTPSTFTPLYQPEDTIEAKLLTIVQKVYGGASLELSDKARKSLEWCDKNGFGGLPVCVAKTQYSVSDDPSLINAPEGFTLHVREIRLSAGAGFLVAICGDIMLMPGLGKSPTAFVIDVDDKGKITGLF